AILTLADGNLPSDPQSATQSSVAELREPGLTAVLARLLGREVKSAEFEKLTMMVEAAQITGLGNDRQRDLPPVRPSFITRVLGVDSGRFRVGQERRARSPQIAQAPGALLLDSDCPVRNAA